MKRAPATAKLNLALVVGRRREDGKHEVATVLQRLDLADRVAIEPATALSVEGFDDTLVRAALESLAGAAGVAPRWRVRLTKRIPAAAGLGGGSSDAASVLLALNRLWSLALPRSELARLGVRLGADVPFFLGEGAGLARGIGDVLTPVSVPTVWAALALPRVHVATSVVFASPRLTRSTPSAKMDVFSEGYGVNDLEAVAGAQFAPVRDALQALRRASPSARMTGSGACVFAPFASEHEARAALQFLPAGMPGCVVRTIARHPLASFA